MKLAFRDFLGAFSWALDPEAGKVNLGNERIYNIQLLGTWAEASNTWRWNWISEVQQDGTHSSAFSLVNFIRAQADVNRLSPEFGQRLPSLEGYPKDTFALIILSMFGGHDFFECPYEGGAGYILIEGLHPPIALENSVLRLNTVLQMMVDLAPDKAESALLGYLYRANYDFTRENGEYAIKASDGNMNVIMKEGRFHQVNLDLTPVNQREKS